MEIIWKYELIKLMYWARETNDSSVMSETNRSLPIDASIDANNLLQMNLIKLKQWLKRVSAICF